MAQRRRSSITQFLSRKVAPDQRVSRDQHVDASVIKETPDLLKKQGCEFAKNGTPEDLIKAIEKFSAIEQPTDNILYLRGNVHLKLGSPEHNQKAINDFTEAIRLSKDSRPPLSGLIAELYYKRAFAHQMLGENDLAVRDYSLFIKYAKGKGADMSAKGYLNRGLVYESMQLMQKALKDIDTAIKLTHGEKPYYLYCREQVRIAMKEKNDGAGNESESTDDKVQENENDEEDEDDDKTFKQNQQQISVEEQANSQMASKNLNTEYEKVFYNALLLSEQGENVQALEKFNNAFKHATNEYEKADSLFRQGLCQYERDQKPEAEKIFREALKHNSKHARAYFRLGLIQTANGKLKDALNDLNRANKYAPNDIDILHERAYLYEKLGNVDKAIQDRRRTMELVQSPSNRVVMLEDRMRHIKAEILQKGESATRHFKIGWIQEALYEIHKTVTSFPKGKRETSTKSEQDKAYEEVVNQFKAAIRTDAEHLCPEAHALLALCQEKKEDYLPAHDSFQNLFQMFGNFPDFVLMWETFVENIKDTNYWVKMCTPPSERVLLKIQEFDRNRTAIDNDEKSFNNEENLLFFYRTCRVQLSHVLAAFALAGCTKKIIAHNMKGSYSKAAFILTLLAKGGAYIPHIGSVLQAGGEQAAKFLKDKDHELITNKLQIISNCGDLIEQNEIARRVARRLTDRYRDQLNRLNNKTEKPNTGCCSCCKSILPFIEPFDTNEPAKRVATFAVSYIVSAVADQSIKTLRLKEANTHDSLVEMLVTLASRACGPKIQIPKYYHDNPNLYLPLTQKPNIDSQTEQQQVPLTENQNITQPQIETFYLYEFFRAPGLRYDPKEDQNNRIEHQQQQIPLQSVDEEENEVESNKYLTSNVDQMIIQDEDIKPGDQLDDLPYMNKKHYGYRLCSYMEFKLLKEEKQNLVERCVCSNNCCC